MKFFKIPSLLSESTPYSLYMYFEIGTGRRIRSVFHRTNFKDDIHWGNVTFQPNFIESGVTLQNLAAIISAITKGFVHFSFFSLMAV